MNTRTRTVTCSMCREPGHNCRTCPMRNITLSSDLPTVSLLDGLETLTQEFEEIDRQTTRELEMLSQEFYDIHYPPLTPPPAPKKLKRTKTPKLQKPYIQEGNHCNICFDNLADTNKVITKCGHKFCAECYTRASRNNNDCAVCRKKLCSVEPYNWKRRYEEIEQDCEYYRNIVVRITGIIVNPDTLGEDLSIPDGNTYLV